MKRFAILACASAWIGLLNAPAQTIATFSTSLGKVEVELFDDKPATTANFIKYANAGFFTNMFVQRWEPNFVIQGGDYYVQTVNGQKSIARIPTFPAIPNEYSVGRRASNVFGTLAMARQGGVTNSATSQWFFNLKDNSGAPAYLDVVDGGFTVFGQAISGQEVLQRFIPAPGTQGIWRTSVQGDAGLASVPVLSATPAFDDLIYVNLSFRRNFNTRLATIRGGSRQITFQSIPGQTNIVELTTNMPPVWKPLTNFVPTSTNSAVFNRSAAAALEIYRVRVDY